MKRITFGSPEPLTPSSFCRNLKYTESEIKYDSGVIKFKSTQRGSVLTFPMEKDEKIYGLGLQLKSFCHNGRKLVMRVNADPVSPTGDSHAPVPFFVSTNGYGIYFDTARYVDFYIGRQPAYADSNPVEKKDVSVSVEELYSTRKLNSQSVIAVEIPVAKGVDIYIIEGENISDIVSQYNMLSGGGCEVPDWGLGVYYRCYSRYNQEEIIKSAEYFRSKEIPCSVLGLEPGWQTHTYSCSYVWDKERYPDHDKMIKQLSDYGYHLNLWEHAFTHPSSPLYEKMGKGCGDYKVWGGYVPDFALPEIRKEFSDYHRKEIIKGCIDGFKLDECDSSDFTNHWSFPLHSEFPSGLDGEQYHSLFGVLYAQTILEALDGKKTYSKIRNMGSLAASYPFVLYSDLYQHSDFIRGCATSGFSGLLWAPEVRHAVSREDMIRRVQTAVFSAQCVINAWYCEQMPWLKFDCEDEIRELFKEREKLLPYLKEAFELYKSTGKPPVRALVADYTSDTETYLIDDQYLLGEKLLVAPMTAEMQSRKIYLPDGEWVNYFTKEKAVNGWFEYTGEQIPVYERVQ